MFRLWGKIIKNNKIVNQYTAEIEETGFSEAEMLDICIDEICKKFDIQKPLWFPLNKKDYAAYGRTVFRTDSFMENIDFDFFEIERIS